MAEPTRTKSKRGADGAETASAGLRGASITPDVGAERVTQPAGDAKPARVPAGDRAAQSRAGNGGKMKADAQAPPRVRSDHEERIRMLAYFLAEQDGFRSPPEDYWLRAERGIDGSNEQN